MMRIKKEMIKIIMKIRNWTNLVENVDIGEGLNEKKRFLSGIARVRGGVYPCPNFLALLQCIFGQ